MPAVLVSPIHNANPDEALLALDILPYSSFLLFVTCECTYVYMVPTDARRRHHTISLKLEQPSGYWEWKPGPVSEQQMLLTSKFTLSD